MNALGVKDLRLAFRRLGNTPGTTIASVAALACGIGAAAATWSLLSAVLLKPLPVDEPDRLFQVESPLQSHDYSYQNFATIRDSGVFDGLAAGGSIRNSPLVTEQGVIPQRRSIFFVNHEFFATLGVGAALGRTIAQDEDRRGVPPVAVLSDRYWRTVFDADPAVLGETVRVSETIVTVVGILPSSFRGLNLAEAPDLYLPLHTINDVVDSGSLDYLGGTRNSPIAWIRIVGRLRPGETPATAKARLNALGEENGRREMLLTNVNTAAVPVAARAGMAQFTTLLSTTVGFLLLIGCLTVGMLLLVRTENRRDEFAVRLALGATRIRLACDIAAEAAILCALGALLAVPVTWWLFSSLRAFQLPGQTDIGLLDLSVEPEAWLIATGAALVTTCLIALLASLVGLGANASAPVQSRTVTTTRRTRRDMRTALVAGQVAITLVLVTGAGLFAQSLIAALSLNAGVDAARIVTADFSLRSYGYTAERAAAFFDELLDHLRQNGSIQSVAMTRPAGGMMPGGSATIDGVAIEMPSTLAVTAVDQDYFSTVGLAAFDGRGFSGSDTAGSEPVAIVSESFGRLIADGGNPIGRRIEGSGASPAVAEIIGLVPDLVTDVNSTEPLALYYPIMQVGTPLSPYTANAPPITLIFRTAGDPSAAIREVTAATRSVDRQVTPGSVLTLDEQIGRQMSPQRFGIYILGTLGGIALLLTVLGTYVMAESVVVSRRREMSIRAALGATGTHLAGLVLGDTARLVGIGLIAGLLLAFLGSRMIRSLLYQVEPLDPAVLTTVAGVILGLALIVSLRPALEAMRLDLTRSLREE